MTEADRKNLWMLGGGIDLAQLTYAPAKPYTYREGEETPNGESLFHVVKLPDGMRDATDLEPTDDELLETDVELQSAGLGLAGAIQERKRTPLVEGDDA